MGRKGRRERKRQRRIARPQWLLVVPFGRCFLQPLLESRQFVHGEQIWKHNQTAQNGQRTEGQMLLKLEFEMIRLFWTRPRISVRGYVHPSLCLKNGYMTDCVMRTSKS